MTARPGNLSPGEAMLLESAHDAAWREQRETWLAVALHRARRLRLELGRMNPLSLAQRGPMNAVAYERSQALARAIQLRRELRNAGFEIDPWLDEAFRAEVAP